MITIITVFQSVKKQDVVIAYSHHYTGLKIPSTALASYNTQSTLNTLLNRLSGAALVNVELRQKEGNTCCISVALNIYVILNFHHWKSFKVQSPGFQTRANRLKFAAEWSMNLSASSNYFTKSGPQTHSLVVNIAIYLSTKCLDTDVIPMDNRSTIFHYNTN